MPSPAETKKSISFEDWFNQDGPLQRMLKAKDPTEEPLLPQSTSEPDTWWGGFAKGLYNEFVRPMSSVTGLAALTTVGLGTEEGIPRGLSKVEFANYIKANPQAAESLLASEKAPTADGVQKVIDRVLGEVKHPTPVAPLLEKHSELGSQPQQVARIADIVRGLTEQNQGTTYNIINGDLAHAKTPTYAVASFPERSVTYKNAPNSEQLADFITKNIDLLKDPTNSIGTWWDKEANEFVLDITKTIPDRNAALALGKKFQQKAIFDLHKMEEIPVPAEKYTPPPMKAPMPMENRIIELLQKFGGHQDKP
jgi:hypothetical protein